MKELSKNVLLGALTGGGVALLLLGVGLVRGLVFMARGGSIVGPAAKDVRLIAAYIGALMLAGALVGLLRPLMGSTRVAYGVFAIAGIVVMNAIAIAMDGLALGLVMWIVTAIIGALFGCAFAYGFVGKPSDSRRVV